MVYKVDMGMSFVATQRALRDHYLERKPIY